MTTKRKVYACDFEATTDPRDCRIWAWQARNIFNLSEVHTGKDADSFFVFIKKEKDCDMYFHNLRYDGSFILNILFNQDFEYDGEPNPPKNTFSTIISEQAVWYGIDITMGYTSKGAGKKKRQHVNIYDSHKKLPFSLKRIAQAFKLPVLKGDIDYHKHRPIGYEMDENELAYLNNDTEILARALLIQFDAGLKKITIGSDALSDFKGRFGKQNFINKFPILDAELDEKLRLSYKGGFTWVNPIHQGKVIDGGLVYDVNSLYPWAMKSSLLPFGEPIEFTGQYQPNKEYPLHISCFKAEFELKENHIPTIQIKGGRFMDNEYLVSSDGEQQLFTMTSVDMELMVDHYELYNVEYIGGYMFKAAHGMFDEYVTYWNNIKMNEKGALRELAKLMLNNLYGKFGKNPDVTPKIPSFENGQLKLSIPTDYYGKPLREYSDAVYIPMGSFITAYARNKTIRTAQELYDRIIYCDTDSIHITGFDVPANIDIHESDLGWWKHETTFTKGKFLRQKTYVEQHPITKTYPKQKRKLTRMYNDFKCAGMPDNIKRTLTFDSFEIGFHTPTGKNVLQQVPGGVVLIDGPYTLK